MKRILSLLLLLLSSIAPAQHPLDRFLTGTPVPTTIGTSSDNLDTPVDLDFCRAPGRTHELWVLNKGIGNSSMTIFFHAGTPLQQSQYRMDSHSGHFMIQSPAFAMAANGYFATVQEVLNSVGNHSSTFMGPTLWDSDTSIFARYYQSNWDPNKPLGSHIDMLHQSPYSMGIAYERNNIYWVFDGYHGNLCKYDFATPHEIGGDDHSDGRIWRYPEVELTRIPDLPAHMVLDSASGWLYIVDNANSRIIRVNTKSGVKARNLPAESDEPLALYWEMKNVVQEVYIDSGLVKPVGIDYWNGRLVVTDNDNGTIRLYDATGAKGTLLGTIATDASSIMGIKIGPDSNLWYVDANSNKVTLLMPGPLGKITKLYPLHNAENVLLTDTLQWRIDEGTFDFITVRVRKGATNILDTNLSPITTRVYFSGLEPGQKYAWAVRGHKDNTIIASTGESFFTTEVKTPAVPTLISPIDLSTNITDSVTLVWAASENATYYQVQLSKQYTFTTPDITVDSTTELSAFVPNLISNTQYFWRVRAHNELTMSAWSQIWSFTTTASGVASEIAEREVLIFPNPTRTSTTIVFPAVDHWQYELFNSLGVSLRKGRSPLSNTVTIERDGLAPGNYTLVVDGSGMHIAKSLIILP